MISQQCKMSPTIPLSRFLSHSLPPSLSCSLAQATTCTHLPPPLSPSQPTTFLHPETPSSLTKAGKDEGRQSGRNTTLSFGPPCVYVPDCDCSLIYTRQQRCDYDQAGLESVAMVACVESLSIMFSVVGVPSSNISESSAAHHHQLSAKDMRHPNTKGKSIACPQQLLKWWLV